MATWKKIIVSGSTADLANLNVDNNISASEFSGSFFGDGSGLTGITATSLDIDNFGSDLTLQTIQGTDKLALSDNGTEGRINVSQLATPLAGTGIKVDSGTLAVDFGDATFQSSVSGAFTDTSASIASDIAGITTSFTLSDGSATDTFNSGETLTFTGANGITTAVTDNTITFTGASGTVSGSEQIEDVVGAMVTGNTETGISVDYQDGDGTLDFVVQYGSSANQAVQGNTTITLTQTSGEIDITGTAAQALGGGPSYTIGLADTITGDRTFSNNVTISGNLTVTGTTIEQQVTNLNVEDQFILLNSGSAAADAGFVVNGQGSAFGWDESASRFAFDFAGATWNQTTITSDAFAAAVVTSDDANYRYNGNIRIDGEDIYIYVE